jgi:hypothetical protein
MLRQQAINASFLFNYSKIGFNMFFAISLSLSLSSPFVVLNFKTWCGNEENN